MIQNDCETHRNNYNQFVAEIQRYNVNYDTGEI